MTAETTDSAKHRTMTDSFQTRFAENVGLGRNVGSNMTPFASRQEKVPDFDVQNQLRPLLAPGQFARDRMGSPEELWPSTRT
jgi:hypothetical protein